MTDKRSNRRGGPEARRRKALERRIQSAMTTLYDPATPHVDLFNMGMIYAIEADADGNVRIDLAFSSPGHPGNLELPGRVAQTVRELEGVGECKVRVVNDPPWSLDRVSDYARIQLSVAGDAS
jgi:metal-sulfur cluster biosynthetic enzyme